MGSNPGLKWKVEPTFWPDLFDERSEGHEDSVFMSKVWIWPGLEIH